MLGFIFLDLKNGYLLWFVCQQIQLIIWFYNWMSLVICLSTDTINTLILYLWSEEKHALNFKIEILIRIYSLITRLISRLLCSGLGTINDHEYILICVGSGIVTPRAWSPGSNRATGKNWAWPMFKRKAWWIAHHARRIEGPSPTSREKRVTQKINSRGFGKLSSYPRYEA